MTQTSAVNDETVSRSVKSSRWDPLGALHRALMPDYNWIATLYWWSMVIVGASVIGIAGQSAALRPATLQLQILTGCLASMLAGAFPVPLPGTKSSFSAAEIFICLSLLFIGLDAACLAAAAEAFVASTRTSKRWTSRLVSPAIAAFSIGVTGSVFLAAVRYLWSRDLFSEGALIILVTMTAVAYFLMTGWLVRLVLHLKNGEPLRLGMLVGSFGWIGTAYAANAFVASLMYLTSRHAGTIVLLAAVPMIALLLTTLHFHFRQRQAESAEAQARVEAAEREVALAARHNQELRHIADHDGLTSLVNRRYFLESLAQAFACHEGNVRSFAVMYLDFDHFKRINDQLGHAAGDEFLVHVSNRILRRVRHGDIVGRLGGDEFAILVSGVADSQVIGLAERLLEGLARPFAVGGTKVKSSASIGITFSHFGYETPEQMLRDADKAMYEAKSQGGARYVVRRPDVLPRAVARGEKVPVHA